MKEWYSRGYIPHFDAPNIIQGITFRLADSLPAHVVEQLAAEEIDDSARRARIEQYLNSGYGACYLKEPRIGRLVETALQHFDGERYQLIAWVVMPNHVHVLAEIFDGYSLPKIVHSWKSYMANEANQLLNRNGRFWFRDFFDRYIRDEPHFANAVHYIHDNPVKAGLVKRPEDWPFSSIHKFNHKP